MSTKISQPLVSMITYCYNGERFVHKYFEAILQQRYDNIELIFFNNGSTDKTGEIAEKYKTRLEARGIIVHLIHYSENQSTCLLKQEAFHVMCGEYFFGCDSDDLIDPDYISTMVKYLQENPDKGIVFCQLRVVEEETNKQLSIMKMIPRSCKHEALKDILAGVNTNYTAISYMMVTRHFDRINPGRNIFISRFGENYQILIPFLYHDLQGYIERPLGQYTVRRDSYTGTLNTEKKIRALKGQEESVMATLRQIGAECEYEDQFLKRIRRDRFYVSLFSKSSSIREECYRELCEVGGNGVKEFWAYYLLPIYKLIKRIK